MTDRYARPTYTNYLSGMGGGALVGYQQQQQQQIQPSDENVHLVTKNVSLKQTTTTQSIASNQTTTVTSAVLSEKQIAMLNLNRNALGDIGNKLTSQAVKHVLLKQTTVQQQQQQQLIPAAVNDQMNKAESSKPVASTCANNSVVPMEEDPNFTHDVDEDIVLDQEETIIDIDELDTDNTQLVAEYVKDIYKYLSQVEKEYRISPTFLEGKIVTVKMRAVLIDWLIQVHLKFHLLQETLYLCVQIIDAYLMAQDVPKMQLQLVGVTAMFVASKYEEMYVPAIDDFVYMTDNTYTKAEIRQMEISILKTLNFMFCKPLPLHFLRRFSKAGQADPKQHTLAKYFMELSLHDAEFSSLDPSYLAACSLCLSFKLLNGSEWNRSLEFYSTYKSSVLFNGMHKIAKLVLKASDLDYKYRAVTNKYGGSKLMRISVIPELSSSYIKDLAAGVQPK